MSGAELAAIEGRHAEARALSCGCGKCAAEAHCDRGALVAEVGRLRALVRSLGGAVEVERG